MDAMAEMMVTATGDLDGDGKMTIDDNYGYAAHSKMTLPSFWVGAGEKSVELDENGYPVLTMTDERFVAVFEKIFAITVDNGVKYSGAEPDKGQDVPDASLTPLKITRALLWTARCSISPPCAIWDTDFGIIPYRNTTIRRPITAARQLLYLPIIPIPTKFTKLTGAVLKPPLLRSLLMRPAYYDVSLKGKITRTRKAPKARLSSAPGCRPRRPLFCADIRDGFVAECSAATTAISSRGRKAGKRLAANSPIRAS